MIIRIFKVRIRPEQRSDFERDFKEISLSFVKVQPGLISMQIGTPTKWQPEDYLLITTWENEQALVKFAGENWQDAVIPGGMEQYIVECWVDHFEPLDEQN